MKNKTLKDLSKQIEFMKNKREGCNETLELNEKDLKYLKEHIELLNKWNAKVFFELFSLFLNLKMCLKAMKLLEII